MKKLLALVLVVLLVLTSLVACGKKATIEDDEPTEKVETKATEPATDKVDKEDVTPDPVPEQPDDSKKDENDSVIENGGDVDNSGNTSSDEDSGVCVDEDKNHACDKCGAEMGEHSDSPDDQDDLCEYCGKTMFIMIDTVEELMALPMNDENAKYALAVDLDLNGAEWAPLGTSAAPFKGIFDGNGFTVSNFKVTKNVQYAGLFAYNVGTIRNLGVKNVNIETKANYVGVLVGYNNKGTVLNCYAEGAVIANADYVGGLMGYNYNGNVVDSYANANVTGKGVVGGLIGESKTGKIENSYAKGAVEAYRETTSAAHTYAGGLAGKVEGTRIVNCYAAGAATSTDYAGGLVGKASHDAEIQKSYATGNVGGAFYAGGLIGHVEKSSMTECYASGDVSNSACAGGLVAVNAEGSIANCYAEGNVSGFNYAGGAVAFNANGIIANSYAKGDVKCFTYAGGLVGENSSGTIMSCYAMGNVESSGFNFSENYAGGLVGVDTKGVITNCFRYSVQTISGSITNEIGEVKDLAVLQDYNFQMTVLQWSQSVWLFTGGAHPTLLNVGLVVAK